MRYGSACNPRFYLSLTSKMKPQDASEDNIRVTLSILIYFYCRKVYKKQRKSVLFFGAPAAHTRTPSEALELRGSPRQLRSALPEPATNLATLPSTGDQYHRFPSDMPFLGR